MSRNDFIKTILGTSLLISTDSFSYIMSVTAPNDAPVTDATDFATFGVVHLNNTDLEKATAFWTKTVGMKLRSTTSEMAEFGTENHPLVVVHQSAKKTFQESLPFSESSNYPVIDNAFAVLHDDAGQRDTLQFNPEGFYQTNQIKGIPGRTYTLDVSIAGTTYSASSKMPNLVNLDTLTVSTFDIFGSVQKVIVPVYTDPLEIGNSYRKIVYVNNQLDKIWELNNDNVNNGGLHQQPIFGSTFELATGDNVKVILQCIDRNVYNYFFTLNEIADGGPGGGITPTNPPNNFSGGALGIFSACTISEKSIIVE